MLKVFRRMGVFCVLFQSVMLHALVAKKNVYQNYIVARVEDSVITKQQLENQLAFAQRGKAMDSEAINDLKTEILNALIEKKIIAKEFERMKGQLPESLIQKKYDAIQKAHFGGDALQFAKALRSEGRTKFSYKAHLREEAIVECMYERNVVKPNTVSPLEIQDYYKAHQSQFIQGKQFNVDQIIVGKNEKEAISAVKFCLGKGLPYEEVYLQLSQIPGVYASRMNDLFEGDVLPVIAGKIATMVENSFDDIPVECGDQMVFLGLRSVKNAYTLTLNEARERIEYILLSKKYQSIRERWIDGLKKKSYYVIL